MWFKSSVGVAVGEMVYNGREWSRAVLIVDHLKGPVTESETARSTYPVIGGDNFRLRRTVSEASILSGHTSVVWLDGERGCVALDACAPIEGSAPHSPATPGRDETKEPTK